MNEKNNRGIKIYIYILIVVVIFVSCQQVLAIQPLIGYYGEDPGSVLSTYDSVEGMWYIWHEQRCDSVAYQMSRGDYQAVLADFDGDGTNDPTIYCGSATGHWQIVSSQSGSMRNEHFGYSGTTPVPGDYDGDEKDDIAVYNAANGVWNIWLSDSQTSTYYSGWEEALPVPADYTGDGKTDIAVYYPKTGSWIILDSADATSIINITWGGEDAEPHPADFDNDGKADPAIFIGDSGTWYVKLSSGGRLVHDFGRNDLIAAVGDFDHDMTLDVGGLSLNDHILFFWGSTVGESFLEYDLSFEFTGEPAWWSIRSVGSTNQSLNEYAPLNSGQLKWMAMQACQEMSEKWPSSDLSQITALVNSFSLYENYSPINVGQLKNVAGYYYDALITANIKRSYPWEGAESGSDYSPANVGQLKYLFSFAPKSDQDGDGLPDYWEILHGLDPYSTNFPYGSSDDPDNDGISNADEFFGDTMPCSSDIDGDGLSNVDETQQGTNPLAWDSDGDGISDGDEVIGGTNPLAVETNMLCGSLWIDSGTNVIGALLCEITGNSTAVQIQQIGQAELLHNTGFVEWHTGTGSLARCAFCQGYSVTEPCGSNVVLTLMLEKTGTSGMAINLDAQIYNVIQAADGSSVLQPLQSGINNIPANLP